VRDGATVPLFYEPRKPELQLNADDLRDELDALLDEAALDEAQEAEVKRVARELLARLRDLLDAIDWTTGQQTRAMVQSQIRVTLNGLPEEPYPEDVWNEKVGEVWRFVLQRYGTGAAHWR
jgi:type I restriction enzyme R subunit